jgi:hypothetical protein
MTWSCLAMADLGLTTVSSATKAWSSRRALSTLVVEPTMRHVDSPGYMSLRGSESMDSVATESGVVPEADVAVMAAQLAEDARSPFGRSARLDVRIVRRF